MIDVVTVGAGGGSIAWISPEGTLKVGPQSAGADPGPICYGRGGDRADDHRRARGARPDPAAPARRRGAARRGDLRRAGHRRAGRPARPRPSSACATGVLEISRVEPGQRAAAGHRQARPRRPRLHDGDVRRVRLAAGLPAGRHPRPRRRCSCRSTRATCRRTACSRSTSATTTCRPPSPRRPRSTSTAVAGRRTTGWPARPTRRWRARASPRRSGCSCAPRTCATSGRPTRCASTCPAARSTRALLATVAEPFHDEHRALYGYDFRDDAAAGGRVGEPPGDRRRPDPQAVAARGRRRATAREAARTGTRPVCFDDWVDADDLRPRAARRGRRRRRARRCSRSSARRCRCTPGSPRRVDGFGNLVIREARPMTRAVSRARPGTDRRTTVDPVLVEIVEGYLASVEQEVETAIGRTSRSPMIRDAHDYRAGIHDRRLRKLTGRSYSALVHPVVRDYPIETMRPGDVFFHNDVYLSEGGIGHLPDLCVTAPVFHDAATARGRRVRAGLRPPRRHRRRGARVDALARDQRLRGGPDGPADPALGPRACPTRRRCKIMTRNSRMPESLAADLDAECSACLMGARRMAELFERYGREHRRGLLRRDPRQDHRDVPPRDPVEDPGRGVRLGGLRRARRRRRAPAAHAADHADPHGGRRPGRRAAGPRLPRHRSAGQGADQPLRRLRRRQLPRRSGSRRCCATSPTPPSGWPSSTSTRASCR